MCRMLGYLGPAIAPRALLTDPPHSLALQSHRPREMISGTVNADGFGAALWLDDGRPEPALYRTAAPIWADGNLGWIAERLRVTALLAAVRSATPGIGYELSSVQPFARGSLAFLHNGFIERFRHGPRRLLREGLLPPADEAVLGSSDSEHLFGLVLDELDRGRDLAAAARGAVARARKACEAAGVSAVATCLLSDGARLLGFRWAHRAAPATLYRAAGPGGAGSVLASEPLWPIEQGWIPVAEGKLLIVEPDRAGREEALE